MAGGYDVGFRLQRAVGARVDLAHIDEILADDHFRSRGNQRI